MWVYLFNSVSFANNFSLEQLVFGHDQGHRPPNKLSYCPFSKLNVFYFNFSFPGLYFAY